MPLDLDSAIALVQNTAHSQEDYRLLVAAAEASGDRRFGDLVEAFIASAPTDFEFPDED